MFSQQNSPKTLVLQTVQYKPLYIYITIVKDGEWERGGGGYTRTYTLYSVQYTGHMTQQMPEGGGGEGWWLGGD